MTYSVWNTQTEKYDYYEAPANIDQLPVPEHLRKAWTSKIGTTADDAGWTLPAEARYIGSGPSAKGMISQGSDDAILAKLIDDERALSPSWLWIGIGTLLFLVKK